MAYVLQVDRLDRFALAAMAAGAEIDPDAERADFDAWLVSEPEEVDSELVDLQRALGVGKYGRAG